MTPQIQADQTHQDTMPTGAFEFSLIPVLRRVIDGKLLLLATTVTGLLLAALVAALWKPWYIAQSAFLPPHASDFSAPSASSVLLGSGSESSDLYLGLLDSRSVQEDVVRAVGLQTIFKVPDIAGARGMLAKNSTFSVGRNSIVSIKIEAADPKVAADIANAYLDALYKLNGAMAASSADARRGFLQLQLDRQRDLLTQSEIALKDAELHTGLVLPAGNAQAQLNQTAQISSQIAAAEERLAGLLVGATDQNPQVVESRAQLAQLRKELASLQADATAPNGIPSNRALPALTLEVAQKQREVKQAETAYETMLQMFSKARLATIDPGPQLQIIDRAVPAGHPAGPNRRLILMLGAFIGALLGLLFLLFVQPLWSSRSSFLGSTIKVGGSGGADHLTQGSQR